ncbi:hypothetical protein EDC96DRAFT_575445 [Choanephora cucurbitarum]|nr:hypothetical protein EDC96DRAFT_575445 [Choanephora cucurbitarum]
MSEWETLKPKLHIPKKCYVLVFRGGIKDPRKDMIDNLVDIVDAKTVKSCRAYLFQIAGTTVFPPTPISLNSISLTSEITLQVILVPILVTGLVSSSSTPKKKLGFKNVKKGQAAKVWDTFVVFKKPSAVKRSHGNANILEVFQGFNVYKQKEGQFVSEDYDVGKAMSKFANESMAHFQQHQSLSRRYEQMACYPWYLKAEQMH